MAFLDADDLWVPEKTRLQLERLESDSELGFVFSDMIDFDVEGEALESYFEQKEYRGPADLTSIFLHDMVSTPTVIVRRERVPGAAVSFAGTDIGSGETVLFAGVRLTSRDTGVLAAIGRREVGVVRRPRVAILSTGDEIVQPGEAMRPGLVYDSNGRILADAVAELGGDPVFLGAFRDDEACLRMLWGRLPMMR